MRLVTSRPPLRLGPQTWARIREQYLSGLSAATVAARFGTSEGSIRRRAGQEGWTRAAQAAGEAPPVFASGRPSSADAAPPPEPGELTITGLLDRLYPADSKPLSVTRAALRGARAALRRGDGLEAHRLARAAEAYRRLEDWCERNMNREDRDLLHAQEDEDLAADGRIEVMRVFIAQTAVSLARDLAAGNPLPGIYQEALKLLDSDAQALAKSARSHASTGRFSDDFRGAPESSTSDLDPFALPLGEGWSDDDGSGRPVRRPVRRAASVVGAFHEFDQDPAHLLRMEEDDGRAVGADAGFAGAEDGDAPGAHFGDGDGDVLDLETDMVLSAPGVLGEEADDRAGLIEGFDEFDLGGGGVDEADLDALMRQVERFADLRRPQHVAV